MPNTYYVYILASKRNGTLYIGVTNDLARRLGEHRDGLTPGFTKRYGITRLVYYEIFDDIHAAIAIATTQMTAFDKPVSLLKTPPALIQRLK